jgi:hypothetical protein
MSWVWGILRRRDGRAGADSVGGAAALGLAGLPPVAASERMLRLTRLGTSPRRLSSMT